MLTGRPPFQGDTPLSVAIQHMQTAPPELTELRPDAPPELCGLVHRLLAKKPSDRPSSASELLRELRNLQLPGSADMPIEDDTLPLDRIDGQELPLEATQQLQQVMQTQSIALRRRPRPVWILIGLLLATAAGCALAFAMRPEPLLRVDSNLQAVAPKATARLQFWHAAGVNTVEAWESVAKYHPPNANPTNRYYSLRAQQHLAYYYLNHNDLDKAWKLYVDLSQLEDEAEFRAIGIAGQAVVLDRRGELDLAAEKVAEAMADSRSLTSDTVELLHLIEEKRRAANKSGALSR
jgi:serine/threonine-protein kinase